MLTNFKYIINQYHNDAQLNCINLFCYEASGCKYVARAVLFDLEPGVIDAATLSRHSASSSARETSRTKTQALAPTGLRPAKQRPGTNSAESPCFVAAFVVNSEPHTGARPSVRVYVVARSVIVFRRLHLGDCISVIVSADAIACCCLLNRPNSGRQALCTGVVLGDSAGVELKSHACFKIGNVTGFNEMPMSIHDPGLMAKSKSWSGLSGLIVVLMFTCSYLLTAAE